MALMVGFSSRLVLISVALIAAMSTTVPAQQAGFLGNREYQICLTLAARDPDAAFEQSLRWQDSGGGDAALHCSAVALFNLGHFAEAGTRLERLARGMPDDTPPSVVAEILAHAGIAWQQHGDLEKALAVQNSALDVSASNPNILTDRAITLFEQFHYWEAIDDLNQALFLAPARPDILALRASAYRHVDALDLALEDVNRALVLEPDYPEALLERGIVYRLQDKATEARADWIRLLQVHEGRPAAETARRNLERLDVQVDDVGAPE